MKVSIEGEFYPIGFLAGNVEDLILFLDDFEIEHDDIFKLNEEERPISFFTTNPN
jgi:hypothetical protein